MIVETPGDKRGRRNRDDKHCGNKSYTPDLYRTHDNKYGEGDHQPLVQRNGNSHSPRCGRIDGNVQRWAVSLSHQRSDEETHSGEESTVCFRNRREAPERIDINSDIGWADPRYFRSSPPSADTCFGLRRRRYRYSIADSSSGTSRRTRLPATTPR